MDKQWHLDRVTEKRKEHRRWKGEIGQVAVGDRAISLGVLSEAIAQARVSGATFQEVLAV